LSKKNNLSLSGSSSVNLGVGYKDTIVYSAIKRPLGAEYKHV